MGLFGQARDAARHSAMHDRSSRQVSLTFDLANRQLLDASPEGSLDAARRRYAEAQQPLQQQAAQKAAGERALRTAGMENLNRIVDATTSSSGGRSDAACRRYAEAQEPLQQQAAQQAAAERAMRMAGVEKLKAKLDDGLCATPDDAESSASCGGGGGASLGNGVSGGSSLASNAAAAAASGDFANATLTGRSLEVASALGSLFADRGRKDPTQGTASSSSLSSNSGGKGSGNISNSGNSRKGNASKPAGAGTGGSIAGLEAALAPWRPEQRRRKGVEIGGGLI